MTATASSLMRRAFMLAEGLSNDLGLSRDEAAVEAQRHYVGHGHGGHRGGVQVFAVVDT